MFNGPDERLFVESKWRYTYTLHAESNTIIHKADKNYDFYLYFRYDYTYQEFLNGKMTRGNWSLNNRSLFYSFQHVNKFEIVQLNKSVMVLEFTNNQGISKKVRQDVQVSVRGNQVVIQGSNPVYLQGSGNYSPDTYTVTIASNNLLRGNNNDSSGAGGGVVISRR